MKKQLLKRVLPVLLALALFLAAAPHAALPVRAEPPAIPDTADSADPTAFGIADAAADPGKGDGGWWEEELANAPDLELDQEIELNFTEDRGYYCFRFVPEATDFYDLTSSGSCTGYISLYDEAGNELSDTIGGGEETYFCHSAILKAGRTYYYEVCRFSNATGTGSRTIRLTRGRAEVRELTPEAAISLPYSGEQKIHWLRFAPEADGIYRLAASGSFYVQGELYDEDGDAVDADYQEKQHRGFSLSAVLEGGRVYYYKVQAYGVNEDAACSVLLNGYTRENPGVCGANGDDLTWSFDPKTHTLTVTGQGDMMDYDGWRSVPWTAARDSIEVVELPEGLTSVGAWAFWSCPNLSGITVPQGVERIGARAFENCAGLAAVTLPESLVSIGGEAFCGCEALTELTLPENLTHLGEYALRRTGLRRITVPGGVEAISKGVLSSCWDLRAVELPEGVDRIGELAFFNCVALEEIEIPAGVRTIEDSAFRDCGSLTAVTLPDSLTEIGEEAFRYCVSLRTVDLPAGVAKIGKNAFANCAALDLMLLRGADCLVFSLETEFDPDETDEDLLIPECPETLGGPGQTVLYGRHDPEKQNSGILDENYKYAEAYAAAYGYTYYDLYAFSDVKERSWYEIPVAWANGRGITSGTGNGKFSPKASCLREQVMTFLWAAAGKPEPTLTENPFTDVDPGKYYAKAVLWAWENGVTGGATATTFGVGKACTRAQVVTFLYAAAGKPRVLAAENPFSDVKETDYFYEAVLWAVENGVTSGTSPTAFSPKQTCTRAQVVTFLYAAAHIPASAYAPGDDDQIYDAVFGEYAELMERARNAADQDTHWLLCAQAEAALLDTAAVLPIASGDGSWTLSRAVPHTTPRALWDDQAARVDGLIVADELLTRAERAELDALWEAALAGNGTYDPAAWLTERGHTLLDSYAVPAEGWLWTLDWLETYSGYNVGIPANLVDGLVEYDSLGELRPALAESWEVSADGLTWTFHIREGVYWYTAAGEPWAELTADDFVAGFRHMLDCHSGLEALAGPEGAGITGVGEYLSGDGSFDAVGCRAADPHTLVFELDRPVVCFLNMLTANTFLPLCDTFYRSRGGVYGVDEYWEAYIGDSYSFAQWDDLSSQVYCGPFLPLVSDGSEFVCVKNPNYYRADAVTLETAKWVFGKETADEVYDKAVSGVYTGVELTVSNGLLDRALEDGRFELCAFPAERNAETRFAALNLNRGSFDVLNGLCASGKTEEEKTDAALALRDRNFRKALQHAFDRTSCLAPGGSGLTAEAGLRNMLTPPELVRLSGDAVDAAGHSFPAGTRYGDLVQYYCDQRGCAVDCADGQDGWYKPELARICLRAARSELGNAVRWPIQIDLVYNTRSEAQTARAFAYQESIEETLGAEFVTVNLIPAEYPYQWQACCEYCYQGADANYDVNDGCSLSGDCGDPCAYLNSFDHAVDGSMLVYVGLY